LLTKSKILLIGLAKDWTGARLLDIPDYQTVTQLTKVLTGFYFLYWFYTEEVDGVGGRRSGDITMAEVQTLL